MSCGSLGQRRVPISRRDWPVRVPECTTAVTPVLAVGLGVLATRSSEGSTPTLDGYMPGADGALRPVALHDGIDKPLRLTRTDGVAPPRRSLRRERWLGLRRDD